MVETDSIQTDGESPASSAPEDRRVVLDLVLAGLICLAAGTYWFWDTRTDAVPGNPAPSVTTTASQPVSRDSFNDEGFRLYSAGDYPGAEAQFRKAIIANPKRAIGHCNLGAALIAQHRYNEAVAALQTAMALDPSLALARANLNWALQERQRPENK